MRLAATRSENASKIYSQKSLGPGSEEEEEEEEEKKSSSK